ncbi:hypothetical protein [Kitasatospora sp. NPDC005751]
MERLGIPLPGRSATTLAAAVTVPDGRPPDAVAVLWPALGVKAAH